MPMQGSLILTQNQLEPRYIFLNRILEGQEVFRFRENDTIDIQLDQDCKTEALLECPQAYVLTDGENRNVECPRNTLQLKPGVIYQISGGSKSLGYYAGEYEILFRQDGKEIKARFCVMPIHGSSKQGQEWMVERLESILSGISFDYLSSDASQEKKGNSASAFYQLLDFEYRHFKAMMTRFFLHMEPVSENEYVLSENLSRQDSKSIRLSLVKPTKPGKKYVRKKTFSYDTEINRSVKRSLLSLQRFLKKKWNEMAEKKLEYQNTILRIEDEMAEAYKAIDSQYSMSFKKKEMNHIRALKSKKEDYQTKSEFIDGLLLRIDDYLIFIQSLLQKTEMRSLDIHERTSLSPGNDITQRYMKGFLSKLEDGKSETGYRLKKAALLFEYYGYYLLDHLLKDKGFELMESNVESFLDFSEDHSEFVYSDGEERIRLSYGKFCPEVLKSKGDETVTLNSYHHSPDYLLECFDKDDRLIREYVLEVKYMPYKNLMGQASEDIQETLLDYLQLGYLNKEKNLDIGKMDKVFLIFPCLNDAISFSEKWGKLYYLGINLEKELEENPSYQKLKSLI